MTSSSPDGVRAQVGDLIARFLPPGSPRPAADDLRLGSEGLGFDSITIVEILLACEQQFDMPFPASLFDRGPLTVGRLVTHVIDRRAARVAR